jgi:hypothetical protein
MRENHASLGRERGAEILEPLPTSGAVGDWGGMLLALLCSLLVLPLQTPAAKKPAAPTLAFDPAGTVLAPGPAGAWDSFATYSPFLVEHGGQYLLFYTGFAARDYSDGAIGLATSPDGVHWTKVGAGPIARGAGALTRIQCAVVGQVEDGSWFLLANGARRGEVTGPGTWLWRAPEPGGPWTAHPAPVLEAEPGSWWSSNVPSGLVQRGDEWWLYFVGWNESAPRMGVARSRDLVTWEPEDEPATGEERLGCDPVLERGVEAWERAGIALYTPFASAGGFEALYVGFPVNPLPTYRIPGTFGLGHATSRDGVHWQLTQKEPLLDTREALWPALGTLVIGERLFVYLDLEGGQKGIGLLSGTLGR